MQKSLYHLLVFEFQQCVCVCVCVGFSFWSGFVPAVCEEVVGSAVGAVDVE